MRVTENYLYDNLISNIENSRSRIADYTEQGSTGKKINDMHTDPVTALDVIQYETAVTENEQFIKNVEDGLDYVKATDNAIADMHEIFSKAAEIAMQGANSTYKQSDRDDLAVEVDTLIRKLVEVGNSQWRGKYIFAGYQNENPPFVFEEGDQGTPGADLTATDPTKSDRLNINEKNVVEVNFTGDSNEIVREIRRNDFFTLNLPVKDLFTVDTDSNPQGTIASNNPAGNSYMAGATGNSATNTGLFQHLIDLRDKLYMGDIDGIQPITDQIDIINDDLKNLEQHSTRIGSMGQLLESQKSILLNEQQQIKTRLAEAEEADLTEVFSKLRAEENALQAALAMNARLSNVSLLNFI